MNKIVTLNLDLTKKLDAKRGTKSYTRIISEMNERDEMLYKMIKDIHEIITSRF